jgi:hypothetical protein
MSRKGHYSGGGTSIGPRSPSWFTKESTMVPRDEIGPRPERSPKEQAEYEALKRERESGSLLIKAGEQVRRKAPHKPKKKRKSPRWWRSSEVP